MHEDDHARIALVCSPEGPAFSFGAMFPYASMFKRPFDLDLARENHAEFVKRLKKSGICVIDIQNHLLKDPAIRRRLQRLVYERSARQISKKVISKMGSDQLKDAIMSPVTKGPRGLRETNQYVIQNPLMNMLYTRDQLVIFGDENRMIAVLCKMSNELRQHEITLMESIAPSVEKISGISIIGKIREPGVLEGGDFFSLGKSLCLVGVGPRTNIHGAKQLMNTWLTSDKVVLVRDDLEMRNERMHLDMVFNVISESSCIMASDIIGPKSSKHRTIEEYIRIEKGSSIMNRKNKRQKTKSFSYVLNEASLGMEFAEYMNRIANFKVLPIHCPDGSFACNILNLGRGRVLASYRPTVDKLRRSGLVSYAEYVEMSELNAMYGSLHCATQIVRSTDVDGTSVPF